MDQEDRALLALIQRDGRMSYAQLGDHVGLSAAAVHDRLKKLKQSGVLHFWSTVIDAAAVGCPVLAFIRIQTDLPANARALATSLSDLPEVLECHHVSGEWNCLFKVRAQGQEALDRLITDRIAPLKGILRLQTEVVSATAKESHILPTLTGADAG